MEYLFQSRDLKNFCSRIHSHLVPRVRGRRTVADASLFSRTVCIKSIKQRPENPNALPLAVPTTTSLLLLSASFLLGFFIFSIYLSSHLCRFRYEATISRFVAPYRLGRPLGAAFLPRRYIVNTQANARVLRICSRANLSGRLKQGQPYNPHHY